MTEMEVSFVVFYLSSFYLFINRAVGL